MTWLLFIRRLFAIFFAILALPFYVIEKLIGVEWFGHKMVYACAILWFWWGPKSRRQR